MRCLPALPFSGSPSPLTRTRTVIEGNKPDQCVGY